MTPIRLPLRPLAALFVSAAPLVLGWAAPVAAQAMIQSLEPSDADRLATQMRTLAANPQDIAALATAGELSLKLGDLSGAAALFARADKVDPRSGRIKAGMASVLVRSERPGEALRFFDQAAGYGWTVDHFAADRGLAYDLIGQNERAQRDYRLALSHDRDDETVRRYALSLGISGQRAEALAQLDPLVRRQDRAGWRAQAFVLAMTGDTPGASKIATAMMPAAMNQGLGAFFQRLPTLSPTDRAFAVHFGEIYPTPERLADAKLAPALPTLMPVHTAPPVQVAAVAPTPSAATRRQRDRTDRRTVQVTQATQTQTTPVQTAPVQIASVQTAPPVRMPPPREVVQTTPAAMSPAPAVATSTPPVAAQAMRETDVRVGTTSVAAATSPSIPATQTAAIPAAAPAVTIAPAPRPTPAVQIAARPTVVPTQSSSSTERADSVLARIVANLSIPATELGVAPANPDPAPVPVPAAVQHAATSTAGKRVVAEASAKEARDGAVRRVVAARLTGDAEADEPATRSRTRRRGAAAATTDPTVEEASAKTRSGRRGPASVIDLADETSGRARSGRRAKADDTADVEAAKPRTRRGARDAETVDVPLDAKAKRAADRKALADKKAAAEKKALAEQAAAEKKAARANPSRIWVQVAGGANEGDLGKAWSSVKAKTPALAGKSGYATPLRATNRVLTGPFRTDAEARAFVNQLKKEGVSGFSFTSDAGQEVTRLGGK